ncbi:MAG: CoA transferase [Chloroflexi bacterium]|nr:CoA transferase [Chloroflexota bacterium]
MLALEGIKVLDFCRNAPGMFCTMVLADLGAEVLMIERPMDEARSAYEKIVAGIDGLEDERRHAAFNALQRNKRSIALNLKEPEAQKIFHKLAETADVVVEGFRPGVMDRLGAGYETVRAINPRAVYCSVSGYGQDGPYSQMAGHDINYISFAGALGLIGPEGGRPAIPLNLIADYAGGGLCGAVGILSALMAREKTGQGQYVDIAMSEGVLYMLSGLVSDLLSRGVSAERGGNRLNGGAPYYNVYQTKDGGYFSIAAIEPWFWENLCRALEREDLLPHQEATGEKKAEVEQALAEAFLTKTRDEWFETLKDQNISVGKVYSLEEALDDPHAQQRGMVVEVEAPDIPDIPGGKLRQVATSIHLSETPGEVRYLGSVTGQHTSEVLEQLGFDSAAVADLMRRQVVQ